MITQLTIKKVFKIECLLFYIKGDGGLQNDIYKPVLLSAQCIIQIKLKTLTQVSKMALILVQISQWT